MDTMYNQCYVLPPIDVFCTNEDVLNRDQLLTGVRALKYDRAHNHHPHDPSKVARFKNGDDFVTVAGDRQ